MLNYNNPFSKKIVATELFLKQCCSPSQQVCGESKPAVSEKLITQEFLLVDDILKSHVAGMVPLNNCLLTRENIISSRN